MLGYTAETVNSARIILMRIGPREYKCIMLKSIRRSKPHSLENRRPVCGEPRERAPRLRSNVRTRKIADERGNIDENITIITPAAESSPSILPS
jgi:hypothetical protein